VERSAPQLADYSPPSLPWHRLFEETDAMG
jgi:hypothetical protein